MKQIIYNFGTGLFERTHPSCSQPQGYPNLLPNAKEDRPTLPRGDSGQGEGGTSRTSSAIMHHSDDQGHMQKHAPFGKNKG